MPLSWTEGFPPMPHLNGYCKLGDCGLITAGPFHVVAEALAVHFGKLHPEINPVIQNEHFEIKEAPDRCDICNEAEPKPPFWVRKVKPLIIEGDADGEWSLCDPCEQILLHGTANELFMRWRTCSQKESPGLWRQTGGMDQEWFRRRLKKTFNVLTSPDATVERDG